MLIKLNRKWKLLSFLVIGILSLNILPASATFSQSQIQFMIDNLSLDKSNPKTQVNIRILQKSINNYANADAYTKQQKDLESQISKYISSTSENISIAKNFEDQLKRKKDIDQSSNLDGESFNNLRTIYINTYNQMSQLQDQINSNNSTIDNINLDVVTMDKNLSTNQARIEELEGNQKSGSNNIYEDTEIASEISLLNAHNAYIRYFIINKNNLFEYYNSIKYKLQSQYNLISNDFQVYGLAYNKALSNSVKSLNFDSSNPVLQKEIEYSYELTSYVKTITKDAKLFAEVYTEVNQNLARARESVNYIKLQSQYVQGGYELNSIINQEMAKMPKYRDINSLIPGFQKLVVEYRGKYLNYLKNSQDYYSYNKYLSFIANEYKVEPESFSYEDKKALQQIYNNLTLLNNQALVVTNDIVITSVNLEVQVATLNGLINKVQYESSQRGFFDRTSNVMSFDFIKTLPSKALKQIEDEKVNLIFNISDYKLLSISIILIILAFVILKLKTYLTSKLRVLRDIVRTEQDSLSVTTLALIITFILSLPTGLIIYSILTATINILFTNPQPKDYIATYISVIFVFYTFINNLARPTGIMSTHLMIAQGKIDFTRKVLTISKIQIYLWVLAIGLFNSSTLTYDQNYIVQILFALTSLYSIFTLPRHVVGIRNSSPNNIFVHSKTYKLIIAFAFILPTGLFCGIIFGFLQSSIIISQNFVSTFITFYLLIVIAAYLRRQAELIISDLTNKNEKRIATEYIIDPDMMVDDSALASLKVSANNEREKFNTSMINFKQLLDLFILFFSMFVIYLLWSDLLDVFSYLNQITIYESVSTSANGTIQKTNITLFSLFTAIIILLITFIINRNLDAILNILIFNNIKLQKGIPYAISSISTYIILAIGIGIAFSEMGMEWSQLQWLFAALSLGLGFGLQEIFANFVSGIILLFERPIRVGDIVSLDNGDAVVAKINTRATTLSMFDGKELIVPNKSFVTGSFINWSLSSQRTRITFDVGVAYGTDHELVQSILLKIAKSIPSVLSKPEPQVFLTKYGDSAVIHSLRVHVDNISDRMVTTNRINMLIDKEFKINNISIPFPQMDIHVIDTPVFKIDPTMKGVTINQTPSTKADTDVDEDKKINKS